MCAPCKSGVEWIYIYCHFFIIILLRSENVCTFVSQVSNGYTLSFFLLLLFFLLSLYKPLLPIC